VEERSIDLQHGPQGIVAIEFLHASEGIDLEDMPEATAIARALASFSQLLTAVIRAPV
jgi:hypothetical protein